LRKEILFFNRQQPVCTFLYVLRWSPLLPVDSASLKSLLRATTQCKEIYDEKKKRQIFFNPDDAEFAAGFGPSCRRPEFSDVHRSERQ
jgi:hypothetical protein